MAFHIRIEKLMESDAEALFRFFDTAYPDEIGELRLDKVSGNVTMTKNCRDAFFHRAARKVKLAHEAGQLPELMTWAS